MRTADMTLSGGRVVSLAMPDMYTILATNGRAPNPGMGAVLRLLEGAGALEQQNLLQRLNGLAEYYRGLYEVAALCLVAPRLRLDGGEAGSDEITPRDLAFNDVQQIYYSFFRTDPPTPSNEPAAELVGATIGAMFANGATPEDAAAFVAALSRANTVPMAGGQDVGGAAAVASNGDDVPPATE